MNDNFLREAVDARLSGLTFSPQMQTDTLRRARQAERLPHARRKLSYSLAFALLALLLAATAGAATYFGVLHFHHEQENNAVYQQHILPIGERLTGQSAAVTVNDAVFDGSSLSFSLDIAHLPGTPETYLFPRVTAMQAGQVIPTAVTGFQQVSEDESYGMGAVLLDCSFYDGIFMPLRGESQAESGHFNLDIALCADLPDPEQPVEWSLTFDEMRPVFALEDAPYTVIEEDESGVSYSWINVEADCLAAYREGRVLLDSESSMMEYAAILPCPDGMSEAAWQNVDLGARLTASGAFALVGQTSVNFTTSAVHVSSLQAPRTFTVGEYTCTLSRLDITFARLEYEITVTRSGDVSAADAFEAGEPTLDFKLTLPDGRALAQSTAVTAQADGSLLLSAVYSLTQPAESVTFTPILPGHLTEENGWMAETYQPTEAEQQMAFTMEAQ